MAGLDHASCCIGSGAAPLMSALGRKRPFVPIRPMSASDPKRAFRRLTISEIWVLQEQARQFLVVRHEFSHIVFDLKTGMLHRPKMGGSDEGEQREQIFQTSSPKCLAQGLPRTLGLRMFDEDQCGKGKYSILHHIAGRRPIYWLLDLTQGSEDRLKLTSPGPESRRLARSFARPTLKLEQPKPRSRQPKDKLKTLKPR